MNRFAAFLAVVVIAIVVALAGFYFYLTGGAQQTREAKQPADTGVVHVKTIYEADGVNMARPVGIGAAANGDFWVTLRDEQKIVAFDKSGKVKKVWGARGLKQGEMLAPIGVDADPASKHVYVTDRSRLRLIAYDFEGNYLWERPVLNPIAPVVAQDGSIAVTTFGPLALLSSEGEIIREAGTRGHAKGQFDHPRAAAALEDGSIVVVDTNNTRVQRVMPKGETTASVTWVAGNLPRFQDDPKTTFGLPTGVTTDGDGHAVVLDSFRHEIGVLDVETGKEVYRFKDLQGDSDGRFYLPAGIAYLGSNTYAIADTYNDRVQIVRLLLPAQNNMVGRNPWLLWLLPLALLPLLLLFGRRRVYATVSALDEARLAGDLRLLAAVYKKIRVSSSVFDAYGDVTEAGVAIAEYLSPVETSDALGAASEDAIFEAAKPHGAGRLLLPRVLVVVRDEAEAEKARAAGLKATTLGDVRARYAVNGGAQAQPSA